MSQKDERYWWLKITIAVLFLCWMVLGGILAQSAEDSLTLPNDISLRIRNIQLDMTKQENYLTQLQIQYQNIQSIIKHDGDELNDLKTEALKTANRDPKSWTVDMENLKFIPANQAPAIPPKDPGSTVVNKPAVKK